MDDEIGGDVIENLDAKDLGQVAPAAHGWGQPCPALIEVVSERIRTSPGAGEFDDTTIEDLATQWVHIEGLEGFEAAFGSERVVTFGNPGGLYELWACGPRLSGAAGSSLDFGDIDPDPDVRVWGTW